MNEDHNAKPSSQGVREQTEFPKRWFYFIAIKIILIAVLGLAVLRWRGLL